MTSLIEFCSVSKIYEESSGPVAPALRKVTLKIDAGEFLSVVGPSGSGKSTLLNILGCLDRPTSGSYRLRGHDTSTLSADELARLRTECFGFVFQSYNLIESLTAGENVCLSAAHLGVERRSRESRAAGLLGALGLESQFDRPPRTLSGGQQQRVAIARAVMNGAMVVLADEPTGALDSQNTREVLDSLSALVARGHTLVIVTHDPEVAQLAHRRIELREGRIVSDVSQLGRRVFAPGSSTEIADIPDVSDSIPRKIDGVRLVHSAVGSIRENLARAGWFRSAFGVLGTALSVWSVVTVLGLVEGGYRQGVELAASTGADEIHISPGRYAFENPVPPIRLTLDDADALREQVERLRSVVPQMFAPMNLRRQDLQASAVVEGVDVRAHDEWPELAAGAQLSESDGVSLATVAVLTSDASRVLFPDAENGKGAVGEYILMGDVPFLVKGVVKPLERLPGVQDLRALVPVNTAQDILFGRSALDGIRIRVRDAWRVTEIGRLVNDFLVRRKGTAGFTVRYQAEQVVGYGEVRRLLSALIAGVGAISMLLGAVGVATLMLMALAQRTREIGVRIACGARVRTIFWQFLFEAVVIACLGGMIGVAFSGLTVLIFNAIGWPTGLSTWILAAGLSVAIGTGIVAGVVPARRAASLDPVEALTR